MLGDKIQRPSWGRQKRRKPPRKLKRNDPKKTHEQLFATHPFPGQSREFVYVYVYVFFPVLFEIGQILKATHIQVAPSPELW